MHQPSQPQNPSAAEFTDQTLLGGRTALVAGGTGNVGRYLVRALLDHGATVVVPSRSLERLEALRTAVGIEGIDRLRAIHADLGDEATAAQLRDQLRRTDGSLYAVVASLGRFVAAPSLLSAPLADLYTALDHYLIAHFLAARTLMPLVEAGGSYTFINGPLAFDPLFGGAGLVSVATAAQAMLARVLIKETRQMPLRVNEVILYTPFGWSEKEPVRAALAQEDVARYVAYLASPKGAAIDGQTIHLNSRQPLESLEAT